VQLRLPYEAEEYRIHFVRMRQARRYMMRVGPDGDLRVTIPRGGSRNEAERFVERHRAWAERQRSHMLALRRPPSELRELRARAAIELPPQLLALAAAHGLSVARVSVRDQQSRWGSCSRLVEAACPGFRDAERWLRLHGQSLF
jgi:predicted metal-dependent hydrolase